MKTAECVTPKHPDKLCDIISDSILDACLKQDPDSRVAIEVLGGHGIITVCGELTTKTYVNIRDIVHKVLGSEYCQYGVQVNIVQQSSEIARGVDIGGAGDQGIMIGYACSDNNSMIPSELYAARTLCQAIYKKYPYDGKTQVTFGNDGEIKTIVASFQNTTKEQLEEIIYQELPGYGGTLYLNPAGDWSQGGFDADTGLTGRKLMVDNYGPRIAIGGGAFSGKDASKVDRSAAYMARKIAVDLLRKYDAQEVFVKLAYAIGVAHPVMATATIKKDGTETILEINDYDLTPKGIVDLLKLKEPKFADTARWGHFGNGFTWDK